MIHSLIFKKMARVLLKKKVRVMRFPSFIEVEDIWTITGSLFDTLSAGFPGLFLVNAGYPITMDNQGEPAITKENLGEQAETRGNYMETVGSDFLNERRSIISP